MIFSSRRTIVAHPLLDPREIFGGERLGAGEIVIKPGVGRRAEGDLRVGVELLDRLGHDVSGVVAQDLEPLGGLAGDDRDRGVMVDRSGEVARPAVDPDRDRRLGQPRPDRRGNLGAGDRPGKLALFAVRQGHDDRWAGQGGHRRLNIDAHRQRSSQG